VRTALAIALCIGATAFAQPDATPPEPVPSSSTSAPPPPTSPAAAANDEFVACTARRRAFQRDALTIADPDARARALLAMPVCRRYEDGRTEIVAAPSPPQPDTTPFHRGLELAAVTGYAATTVMSTVELAPTGGGPFAEVDIGDRWRREMSLDGYLNFTHFSDSDVAVSNGPSAPASIITVTDNVFGFGVRGSRHVGAFAVGLGLGAAVEATTGYQGMKSTNLLRSVDAHVAYQLAVSGRVAAELMLIAGDAGHPVNTDRELVSFRLAIGLHL